MLLRIVMACFVSLSILACGNSGEDAIKTTGEAEITEDFIAMERTEVKAVFDETFCKMENKTSLKLNICRSYKKQLKSSGKCRDHSVGKKRIQDPEISADNLVNIDYSPDDLRIDIFDDLAVVKYVAVLHAELNNQTGQLSSAGTMEFVKEDGQWKMVHEHLLAKK
ncbi:hypothetical protein E7Z59_07925 [Robertkochia marina]|uniref:SnoaL-like domain-containing protein n=1 Tax=Robertkochia marina TaxID=1227945 RepID=A0A4S3LZM0_9FLAO|nr:nuclear transport factor 2 family protein [Robertkochia marina]THD67580.1 hypothetical protein E7Z59_07925 [Robertkochia marina]